MLADAAAMTAALRAHGITTARVVA
jgi:hypothetical protein